MSKRPRRPRQPKQQSSNAVAIRHFTPVYCNTCTHFDLERAAKERAPQFCPHREMVTDWDHRACVLYTPVNDNQRQGRRMIVQQLHEDKKGRVGAEAKKTAETGN